MLTNHDMDSRTPFATVLIGQPTLRRMIKLGVLAALDQRIAVRYQMTGMTPDETGSYIRHHLQLAGRDGDLFSDDATAQIHDAARGKPRAVNNLASPRSSPPTPPEKRSSTSPPPAPPSARSYQQNEHPADTMNSKPRPAPPGGVSPVAHTLTANDAATLTLNVAEQNICAQMRLAAAPASATNSRRYGALLGGLPCMGTCPLVA